MSCPVSPTDSFRCSESPQCFLSDAFYLTKITCSKDKVVVFFTFSFGSLSLKGGLDVHGEGPTLRIKIVIHDATQKYHAYYSYRLPHQMYQ